MADQTVTIRITADAKGLVTGVALARKETEGLGDNAEKTGARAAAGFGRARAGVQSISDQLRAAKQQLLGFVSAFASIHGARQLAALADQAANIRAQLSLSARSAQEYARAQEEVYAISQRTSAAMASTAELYARITRSVAEYGVTQERVLRLTETINQTFAVSAAPAAAQANAITQLTQAFAGGVLRAEEFNSVVESSPRLAQALADGLGLSIGQLRQQVNAGAVDVQAMITALENQAEAIEREFSHMPLTIERAWTQIGNAVLKYVGDADAASGASREIAKALSWVADHIAEIISAAWALGKALAALYTAKLLSQAALYTAELAAQARQYVINIALTGQLGLAQQQGFLASLQAIGKVNAALHAAAAAFAGWQIGTWLREQFLEVEIAGIALVGGLLKGWETLKAGGVLAWEGMKAAALGALNVIRDAAASMVGILADANEATDLFGIKSGITERLREVEQQLRPTSSAFEDFAIKAIKAMHSLQEAHAEIDLAIADQIDAAEASREAAEAAGTQADALQQLGQETEENTVKDKDATKAKAALIEQAKRYLENLREQVAMYGLTEDARERAKLATLELTDAQRAEAESLLDLLAHWRELEAVMAPAHEALEELSRGHADLDAQIARNADALAGLDQAQIEYNAAVREQNALVNEALALGPLTAEQQEAHAQRLLRLRELMDQSRAIEHQNALAEAARRAAEDSAHAWERFTGDLADAIANGAQGVKRWWRAMLDDMKRQLIQSGLMRLFQGLFGAGGGGMRLAGAGSGTGIGSLLSLFGGAGGGGGLFNASSWARAGQSLWSGFSSGWQGLLGNASQSGLLGSLITYNGASVAAINSSLGFGGMGPPSALAGSGSASGFGIAGAASMFAWFAAAIIANMSLYDRGWKPRGETITLPNGQQVHGGGRSGAADFGGAAISRIAESVLARIGLSERWASIISGGALITRVFGRKRPELRQAEIAYQLGAGGVTGAERYHTVEQGGLFRSTRRRWHEFEARDEVLQAAQSMWQQVSDTMRTAAMALGAEVPENFTIGFRHWQKINGKTGAVEAEKFIVELLGRTWEEATAELAVSRLNSEALIAVIEQAFGDASVIAERWRDDAQTLADGAQFLLFAASDIRAGASLLGEGATLGSVAALVEGMARGGETLSDAYARLSTATALLDQALSLSGVSIDATREQIVRLASDIADAAGGIEQAQALWQQYFEGFYSDSERAAYASQQRYAAGRVAFGGIGLDLSDYTGAGGLAAFREQFEAALPTLTADQVVQWLRAAAALSSITEAARQIDAELADNAWQLHLESLDDAARAVAEINRRYDDMRRQMQAAGASVEQLTQLEGQRDTALQQYRQSLSASISAESEAARARLSERGLSDYAREQARIAREVNRAVAQAQEAGASAAEILAIRLAGMERAALSAAEAMADFASELADWELEDQLAGMSQAEQAIARENQRWQARYNRAVEIYGDSSEEAARVMALWSNAIRRTTEAVRDSVGAIGRIDTGSILDQIAQFADELRKRLAHLMPGDGLSAWLSELSGLPRLAQQSVRRPLREVAQLVRNEYLSQTQQLQQQIAGAYRQLESLPWDAQGNRRIIEGRIQAMQDALNAMTGGMAHALDQLRQMYMAQLDGVRQYLNDMLLNTAVTTLTPQQQLAEAQRQYEAALSAARAGDTAAIQSLPQVAQQYLNLARSFWSSGDQYQSIFDGVRGALQGLLDVDFSDLINAGGKSAQTAEMQLDAAQQTNALLARIVDNLRASNSASGVPAYASGGWVNGPTQILAGEAGRELVLPNAVSEFLVRTGIPVNTGGGAVQGELRALREELRQLRAERLRGDAQMVSATSQAGAAVAARIDSQTRSDDQRQRAFAALLPRHARR